ncbi:Asp23/Gls24 family envelope stress response protein [Corynebacterium sp. CCUG 51687]|uniref:Asp23/Gls24 family envelope stress response protein n=1 Tax=Corynebacterium sp. CCUG 51687 TaxID=2823897 RepID=UPI00210E1631|nr:Asp23/Gls24 family envelope stress response protein [Corynebacterium sp. CCUG 51687]MCQ4611452.1 Asp23/Gls24 family envelope stress response protein [Corynebacterium sp. CCUG 51687]
MASNQFHLSERVIAQIAEVAASSVPGTIEMDAKLAGLAGRSFPQIDVRLDRVSGTAAVEAEIATTYPAPIAAITDAVRSTIISHIRTLTGLDVSSVNIEVANVTANAGEPVSWDDVANHQSFIIPTPLKVKPLDVESPTTKEPEPLHDIVARSLVDDLTDTHVPEPVSVKSIAAPTPYPVRTKGFEAQPTRVFRPQTPEPARLLGVQTHQQRVYSPSVPQPAPLKPIRVKRTAAPTTVSAPQPQPLREITIKPAVKYYDRT